MMMMKQTLVPVGALVMALSVGGYSAEAGQRDRNGRDRNGRASQGSTPDAPREGAGAGRREGGQDRGARAETPRNTERSAQERRRDAAPSQREGGPDQRDNRGRDERARQAPPPNAYRYDDRSRRDGRDGRYQDSGRYRGDSSRAYAAPRVYRPAPRRYYGPGGGFSVYFGLGNGYLFGSPWSGRVYGYRAPYAYGSRVYYGDVRLQVQPRDAAVYVDGYYAGVVDSFDGVFQRLTLEVGPHTIELDGPGLEPQVFDIYVDPARTTTIRTDLFR